MLCCLHHLDISTETVFCNVMLFTPSWYLDWDLYSMLCCLRHLDNSTQTTFCNVMLLTPSQYLDWDCILQWYAAYAILIYRLRLHFALLCCIHFLDISTETVFCNAMLLTPSYISTQTTFCNAKLHTLSRYLKWDCILQCYAAYAILISRLRLYFTMLCC